MNEPMIDADRTQLARHLGTTREVVARLLGELRTQGLLPQPALGLQDHEVDIFMDRELVCTWILRR